MKIRLCSKEQEELVLKNKGLVHHLIKKLNISYSDYEDIVSIGTIGLIKAAATFEESKNIQFATYAARCINNEIFMHFRKEKSHINDISLNETLNVDTDGNKLTLCDILESSDKDLVEQIEENYTFTHFISIILNLLEGRERLIMLYQIAGATQRFIADIFNIEQSYVSRLEKKINAKVKSYFRTEKQFKEVFSMAIVGDFYQITFSSKNLEHFNEIFAKFLKNLTSTEGLPDFEVTRDNQRILIQIPAHPESFSFIAQIIKEIDNYSLKFASTKTKLSNSNTVLPNTKTNIATKADSINKKSTTDEIIVETIPAEKRKEIVKEPTIESNSSTSAKVTKKKKKANVPSKVKQVRDYILSKDSFTTKELKQRFPNLSAMDINNAIHLAKCKGLITSIDRGKYKVNKN